MFNPKKIKVIVWDVDGTLYMPTIGLVDEEFERRVDLLAKVLKISREKAERLSEATKKITKSSTLAVSKLTGLPLVDIFKMIEGKIDRSKYLKKDEKLIFMFKKLKSFRHMVVSNILRMTFDKTIGLLGLDKNIFEYIVTADLSKTVKPNLKPFKMILEKTKLPADNHLFVGDREGVDIIPAKKVGMQTCFVWGESEIADVSIPDVYKLPSLLGF